MRMWCLALLCAPGRGLAPGRTLPAVRGPPSALTRHFSTMSENMDAASLEEAAFKDPETVKEAPSRARDWFTAVEAAAEGSGVARVGALEAAAAAAGARLGGAGLPTGRGEAWRFTRLGDFWGCAPGGVVEHATTVDAAALEGWLPGGAGANVCVVVDGVVDADLSRAVDGEHAWLGSVGCAPAHVLRAVGDLGDLPEVDLEDDLPARTKAGAAAWCLLNARCARDAVVCYVAPEAPAGTTFHVVHVRSRSAGVAHARTIVAAGGACSVRESFCAVGNAAALDAKTALTNARTSVLVADGGAVTLVLDAQEVDQVHVHHVAADVGAGGSFDCRLLSDAAKVARVVVDAHLRDPSGNFAFSGIQLGAGDQNLDARTALRHADVDGTSTQDVRNVAAGSARLTFKGRIAVPQKGQRTDAQQICRSLLLDDSATIDAMPSLEIVADDVKCSHGATVADLDEESVFYLASRGLDDDAARALLVRAFCYEIVSKVGDGLVSENALSRIDAKLDNVPRWRESQAA